MTRVALPAGYRAGQLQRVLQSILDYDQLDDWIPDPIYYRDVAAAAFLKDVQATIDSGAVACEQDRGRASLTGRGAGDEGGLPVEVERTVCQEMLSIKRSRPSDRGDGP